jgi:hypothetical protein
MCDLSCPTQSFPTFHGRTIAIPAEITVHLLRYVIADIRLLLLGGGASRRRSYNPVASVSVTLRKIYLDHPMTEDEPRARAAQTVLSIREALRFNNL